MSTVNFSAYTALGSTLPAGKTKPVAGPETGGNQITEGIADFKAAIENAEKTAMQTAVTGADPHAMVEALANAELVLDTAVIIRNKVVEAYQELLRMPV